MEERAPSSGNATDGGRDRVAPAERGKVRKKGYEKEEGEEIK